MSMSSFSFAVRNVLVNTTTYCTIHRDKSFASVIEARTQYLNMAEDEMIILLIGYCSIVPAFADLR